VRHHYFQQRPRPLQRQQTKTTTVVATSGRVYVR
jgi:hypothetical protein